LVTIPAGSVIVAEGDSQTAGTTYTTCPAYETLTSTPMAYTCWLAVLANNYTGIQVYNIGINGRCQQLGVVQCTSGTASLYNSYQTDGSQNYAGLSTTWLSIMIGGNDVQVDGTEGPNAYFGGPSAPDSAMNVTTFQQDTDKELQWYIQTKGQKPSQIWLTSIAYQMPSSLGANQAQINSHNQMIKVYDNALKYEAAKWGTLWVDVNSIIEQCGGPAICLNPADGLHFNPAAATLVGNAFANATTIPWQTSF